MNIFQTNFFTRLKSWRELRDSLTDLPIETQCIEIDKFWQTCPMSNHYLHPADIKSWPDPWQLIDDNLYCPYARALGIIYTFVLLGQTNIELVEATDYNSVTVILVLVDNAKHVLNYWPNTVINNKLNDFSIVRQYDITPIIKRVEKL